MTQGKANGMIGGQRNQPPNMRGKGDGYAPCRPRPDATRRGWAEPIKKMVPAAVDDVDEPTPYHDIPFDPTRVGITREDLAQRAQEEPPVSPGAWNSLD